MKPGTCLRCGTKHQPTSHHVIPKVWKRRTERIWLCKNCHYRIEDYIKYIEMHRSGFPLGQRYRLDDEEYIYIAENFCRKNFS